MHNVQEVAIQPYWVLHVQQHSTTQDKVFVGFIKLNILDNSRKGCRRLNRVIGRRVAERGSGGGAPKAAEALNLLLPEAALCAHLWRGLGPRKKVS
jgi:hypothetical protein